MPTLNMSNILITVKTPARGTLLSDEVRTTFILRVYCSAKLIIHMNKTNASDNIP
ncbi:hypothetical protein VNF293_41540 [Atlantibacter hermannii]